MKYKVISDESYRRFQQEVNNRLKDGWILQGGIAVISNFSGTMFYQAMVKK